MADDMHPNYQTFVECLSNEKNSTFDLPEQLNGNSKEDKKTTISQFKFNGKNGAFGMLKFNTRVNPRRFNKQETASRDFCEASFETWPPSWLTQKNFTELRILVQTLLNQIKRLQ